MGKVDSPVCREDLIRKAAASDFRPAFDWINDKEALRVTGDPSNQGLTADEIKELAREWILEGNDIKCVPERREDYRDRRHFHYDIIIQNLATFSRGLYVYMELSDPDETDPTVSLLNAHPPGS